MTCLAVLVRSLVRAPTLPLTPNRCCIAVCFPPLCTGMLDACMPELLPGPQLDREGVFVLLWWWPYREVPSSDCRDHAAGGVTALVAVTREECECISKA